MNGFKLSEQRWLIAMSAVFLILTLASCNATEDNGNANGHDTASDTDADTDADSDSDTDSDSDSDSDSSVDAGVIDMDCSSCPAQGPTLQNLICAIDLCEEEVISQQDYSTPCNLTGCTLEDTYEAVDQFGDATNDLAPQLNDSYALMASGPALGDSHSVGCDPSCNQVDPYSSEDFDANDVMEWRLVLKAPDEAQAFRFKYIFFSEEYDEWISSMYNDKFYAILEAGSTNDGSPTVINYTECREPDIYYDFEAPDCDLESGYCCFIAINSALSECCWYPNGSNFAPNPGDPACPEGTWETDISGTGYTCAADVNSDTSGTGSSTGWLQTSWPIDGGENFAITFHIHDTSDAVWDSEVIIDSFQFLKDPDQGTVPIE